jgi:ADP-ribose pyrophosphatase YjhB (NUDIX family)
LLQAFSFAPVPATAQTMAKSQGKNSHCSYCGTAFPGGLPWPRTCGHCKNISYLNPLPVVVVLVPVLASSEVGLVMIRRGLGPGTGKWALPGGFVDAGETWQEAAAREVREETGIILDDKTIREFRLCSAPDDTLLIFCSSGPVPEEDISPFVPCLEARERRIASMPPEDMAFMLHRETMELYLAKTKDAG